MQQQQQPSSHPAAASLPPPPPPPLAPGWMASTDPVSGRVYYANPTTGETQWTPPVLVVPPPTAVAPPPPIHPSAVAMPAAVAMPTAAVAPAVVAMPPVHPAAVQTPAVIQHAVQAPPAAVPPGSAATVQTTTDLDERLSVGTLADLCHMAHGLPDWAPYKPLEPTELASKATKPPSIEPGRVDIRLASLYDKLQKL